MAVAERRSVFGKISLTMSRTGRFRGKGVTQISSSQGRHPLHVSNGNRLVETHVDSDLLPGLV